MAPHVTVKPGARGIYQELNDKRQLISNLPIALTNKLEQLDEAMTKLGDWHAFAVTPKKEALIAEMTALQESTLAADELADKIHHLQEQWKTFAGGQHQDEAPWQAFQSAADTAFAPAATLYRSGSIA